MKNFFKLFGIAAIVAVIAFAMVACVSTPQETNPESDPKISVELSGEVFSLDPDEPYAPQPVAKITVDHLAAIKEWTIQVQPVRAPRPEGEQAAAPARPARPEGEQAAEGEAPRQRQSRGPFFEVKGTGNPPNPWTWNGESSREPREGGTRARIQSAANYQLTVTVTDNFGNTTTAEQAFETDVLVRKEGEIYRIIVPSIVFPGGGANLDDPRVSEQDQRSNTRILRLIARALNRFESYKVLIEGHSNPENAPGTPARETEETRELVPLSKSRADAVLNWLVANGNVDKARLSSVGMGGRRVQVAFDEDPEEKANNRRVEFILEK